VKAVILAGGQGTRLRPLTSNQPKPMLPIANRPIMEHLVNLLRRHDVTDQIATVQFLGSVIRSYFGNGEDHGVALTYATEETPLGTAGSVKNAEDELREDTFLAVVGDALTDIDLTQLVKFHKDKGAVATICLVSVPNPLEFGIVITREDGSIERFLEKPNWGQVFSDTINTGIYVLEPEIFEFIPEETVFDFSEDLFPLLLDKGLPLYGYLADGYWRGETHRLCDRPASLIRLIDELIDLGVEQIVLVSAAPESPGPHALAASRLDGRGRLGEYLQSAEASIVRDATTTTGGVRIFTVRPSHNPIGPFDFDGGYDDRSHRRQGLGELMSRGYEDAYHQFVEPVVGASGERVGI